MTFDEGAFHFLIDFAQREPFAFIGLVIWLPVLLFLLTAATLKRVHPIVVWFVLFAGGFGFSQIFPENRNQRLSIGIGGAVLSAVLVWWWFGRIAPQLRAKLQRRHSTGPPVDSSRTQ